MEKIIVQKYDDASVFEKVISFEIEPDETPEKNPDTKPEVEPDALPEENPGIQPGTRPGEHDDDDDDPYTETEIGDDPDEIGKKTTIM